MLTIEANNVKDTSGRPLRDQSIGVYTLFDLYSGAELSDYDIIFRD